MDLPSECPDLEKLAAFQEGSLTQDEQEDIEAHLVRCARCFAILKTSIKSETRVLDPKSKDPVRS